MPGPQRTYGGISAQKRRDDRRRRLLDAGFTMLADEGPQSLKVTAVCAAAKLTSRYFYEHFPDREALLAAIIDQEARAVSDASFAAARAAEGDAGTRARAAFGALLTAIQDDPRRLRMAQRDDEVTVRLRAVVTERMSAMLAANGDAFWPGHEHDDRLPLTAALTVGGLLHLVAVWAAGNVGVDEDELVRLGARFAVATGESMLG